MRRTLILDSFREAYMQRVPSKNVSMRGVIGSGSEDVSGRRNPPAANAEKHSASPMYLVAKRIADEQGRDRLKDFLLAMRPFAAPNELISIGKSFGVDIESIPDPKAVARTNNSTQSEQNKPANTQKTAPTQFQMTPQSPQLQMLQTIITLQNMMGRGGSAMPQFDPFMQGFGRR